MDGVSSQSPRPWQQGTGLLPFVEHAEELVGPGLS